MPPKFLLIPILYTHSLQAVQAENHRNQKGVWKRVAPCLYRYRGNGSYYAVAKRQGKIIRRSLETDRLEIAKRKLRDFLNQTDLQTGDAHMLRFEDYINEFLAGRTGRPKTLQRYHDIAERIRRSWPGGVRQYLRNIDLAQCSRWLTSEFNGKTASYNLARQWLQSFFHFALENAKIVRLPFSKRSLPPLKRPKPIRNVPAEDEFEAIISAVRSQRFTDHADDTADLIEFMGRAGAGQAEAAALKWEHIDLCGSQITLFRAKTRTAFTIPIFPKLHPLLERLKQSGKVPHPGTKVFPVADPKKALAAACHRLGLPSYSPRSLRRMFIIEALTKGVPVKTISKWQGHQDGGVLILKTYSEVIDQKANQEAANLLA